MENSIKMSIKLLQTFGSSMGYFSAIFLLLRRACHELYWKMFDIFHVHNSGLQDGKLLSKKFVVINISDVIYFPKKEVSKSEANTGSLSWSGFNIFPALFLHTSLSIFYNRFLFLSPKNHYTIFEMMNVDGSLPRSTF